MNVAKARKLRIADIADIRAYERERVDFRGLVIALKQRRRVSVGPYITFVFENRDTIRFQIQEMARVEKLYSDDRAKRFAVFQQPRDIELPLIVHGIEFAVGSTHHAARSPRQKCWPQSVQCHAPSQYFGGIQDEFAAVLVANNSGHVRYLIPGKTNDRVR